MKTKIILVKHAECFGNISNKLSGRTNFELTDDVKSTLCDILSKKFTHNENILEDLK